MVTIQMNKKMSNSFQNNVEMERSVNDAHGAESLTETGEMNG